MSNIASYCLPRNLCNKTVQALELRRTVFRSDHAANGLELKGIFGVEKAHLSLEGDNPVYRFDSAKPCPSRHLGL